MGRMMLRIVQAWRLFRDPYRPELHYMRGPGPRTLERKQTPSSKTPATTSNRIGRVTGGGALTT